MPRREPTVACSTIQWPRLQARGCSGLAGVAATEVVARVVPVRVVPGFGQVMLVSNPDGRL